MVTVPSSRKIVLTEEISQFSSKLVGGKGGQTQQITASYVRPHLDYGDIIYHKYDPEYALELIKKM